jgi:hypothetical protein
VYRLLQDFWNRTPSHSQLQTETPHLRQYRGWYTREVKEKVKETSGLNSWPMGMIVWWLEHIALYYIILYYIILY